MSQPLLPRNLYGVQSETSDPTKNHKESKGWLNEKLVTEGKNRLVNGAPVKIIP